MKCECSDPGCPMHTELNKCHRTAKILLLRVDTEDKGGTAMCSGCAEDAMDSGLFREVPLVRRYS